MAEHVGRRFDGRGACQGQKCGEARQEGGAGSGCACGARLKVAPSAQAESASRGVVWAGGRAVVARNGQGKVHARPKSWRALHRTRANRARLGQRRRQEFGRDPQNPAKSQAGCGQAANGCVGPSLGAASAAPLWGIIYRPKEVFVLVHLISRAIATLSSPRGQWPVACHV